VRLYALGVHMALPVLRMDLAPPKPIAISGLGGAFQIGSCRKRSQHLKDAINIIDKW